MRENYELVIQSNKRSLVFVYKPCEFKSSKQIDFILCLNHCILWFISRFYWRRLCGTSLKILGGSFESGMDKFCKWFSNQEPLRILLGPFDRLVLTDSEPLFNRKNNPSFEKKAWMFKNNGARYRAASSKFWMSALNLMYSSVPASWFESWMSLCDNRPSCLTYFLWNYLFEMTHN